MFAGGQAPPGAFLVEGRLGGKEMGGTAHGEQRLTFLSAPAPVSPQNRAFADAGGMGGVMQGAGSQRRGLPQSRDSARSATGSE